jgi:hypothetical protein
MTQLQSSTFPAWHADPRLPTDRPFTTAEARRLGIDGNGLARLVRQGALRRVLHGVYVDAAVPDSVDERARAVALAVPEDAVITDATAAWLYGINFFDGNTFAPMPRVQYFGPLERTRVRRAEVQGGRRMLAESDLVRIGPVWVTTPLRTACDLGRSLRRAQALAALDALLRLGDFTAAQLDAEIKRFRGRRGVVQLRDLVLLADGRADSVRESELRMLWIDAGLPKPQLQIPVLQRLGREPFRLDIGDPKAKYAAEYDGEEWHSTPEQIARDAWRRQLIRGDGWTIDVFGNQDLHRWSGMTRLQDGYRRAVERARRTVDDPSSEAERAVRAFGLPRYADNFLVPESAEPLDPHDLGDVPWIARP